MRPLLAIVFVLLIMAPGHVSAGSSGFNLDTLGAEQAVLVLTEDWNSVKGEARLFHLDAGNWKQAGVPIPVVVGRKGLGWGIGLHPTENLEGPRKREGDGKGVAGAFRMSLVMGYDSNPPAGTSLPYRQSKKSTRCVDDAKSKHYNRLVELAGDKKNKDWKSSEKMRRKDHLYKWLIAIDHNSQEEPDRQGGSCIFFHVWRAGHKGTAGCTATREQDLVKLIQFLKGKDKSVLIQLPKSVYRKLAPSWHLPALDG